jgi:cell division protein FtsB
MRRDSASGGSSPVKAAPPPARPSRRVLLPLALVATLVLALFGAGIQGYRDLAKARARVDLLTARKAETARHVADLERRIERLRSDPMMLERLAREELGMVQPDDVVIVFPAERP